MDSQKCNISNFPIHPHSLSLSLKVWDLKEKKLSLDLPGHADEVFSVDWSPDGERVASGGRDRMLKM